MCCSVQHTLKYYQHPQPQPGFLESRSHFSGGKNSSTGNSILSNKSQGLSSVEPTHSFCGTQKSRAGIRSCTRLSSLIIEKMPRDTNTLFCSPSSINLSSKTLHTDSGTLEMSRQSSQQQQFLSFTSTTFAPRQIGSTTSTTAFGILVLRQSCESKASSLKLDEKIFALPSEPKRITFLSKVARPSTWHGLPTPVNTASVTLKKYLRSTEKKPRLNGTDSTSVNTQMISDLTHLTLIALSTTDCPSAVR